MSCPTLEAWLEALDGESAAPADAHEECAGCRRSRAEAEQLLRLMREAATLGPAADEKFVRRVVSGKRRMAAWVALALAAPATTAVLLYARAPDSPVARGGVGRAAICDVLKVTAEGLRPAASRLLRSQALAFAVRNAAPHDRWLGVFAITAAGRVAWYQPAYESSSEDPALLPVPAGARRTLPEEVALPLGDGEVRVFCWLSDRPWRVREADAVIERAVAAAARPAALERVPELGGEQESVTVWFGEP
jgi:hypothetical protein